MDLIEDLRPSGGQILRRQRMDPRRPLVVMIRIVAIAVVGELEVPVVGEWQLRFGIRYARRCPAENGGAAILSLNLWYYTGDHELRCYLPEGSAKSEKL